MFSASLALLAAQTLIVHKVPANRLQRPAIAAKPALSDEQIVRNAQLDPAGSALLSFFRRRSAARIDSKHMNELAKQLGDNSTDVHTKAAAELVGLGPLALPALHRAVNHAEDETVLRRARKCLQAIERPGGTEVVLSAVRLLAAHNPKDADEVLLAYLPLADDDTVIAEIETALLRVGLRDGKPTSSLVQALSDATPIRRRVAAHVLCRIGGANDRAKVRSLLKDPKPSVRKQTALGLAEALDAEAMPVLIALVADLPPHDRKEVEDYLTQLAGQWAITTPQGNDATSSRLRRELWSAWWHGLDGEHLLQEFRSRTLDDDEYTRLLQWFENLKDKSPDVRTKASENIVRMGAKAAPLLRRLMDGGHSLQMPAARQCLHVIERDQGKPLPEAAPRLLALRRPEGCVEAILRYLPFAETTNSADQLISLLAVIGVADGKADPALAAALADKISVRRAAAAVALCKGGTDSELPAVRRLLRDKDALVRLRTAVALAERGEKQAVPVLIALLGTLPMEQIWEVEDLLAWLAGDKAPKERIGDDDDASRAAAVAAWNNWWRNEKANVDLARLNEETRDRGFTTIIEMQQGRVLELDRTGRVRWQIQGLHFPWDAAVCPNGNVFIIQLSGNQVTLRDRQGKEIWKKPIAQAINCQRLRNGNFFVVCRQQFVEFDAHGKQVFSRAANMGWIVDGRKLKNGHVAFVNNRGQYVRMDANGKQLKTLHLPIQGNVLFAEVLPGDRVVATLSVGAVAEYDGNGKQVWQAAAPGLSFPHKLPNGHTVVPQQNTTHVYEFDRAGKTVANKKDMKYHPFRIRRR